MKKVLAASGWKERRQKQSVRSSAMLSGLEISLSAPSKFVSHPFEISGPTQ